MSGPLVITSTKTGDEMPAVDDGTQLRFLGRKFGPPKFAKAGPQWTAAGNPIIPLKNIPDFDRRPDDLPTLDQNGNGSCVGHGGAQAMMMARFWAGMTYNGLSADALYAHINGGRDQGAIVSDAIAWITSKGIEMLEDVPDEYILEKDIPKAASVKALRFRASPDDVYQINTFEELATAMWLGYATVLTINVGGNFKPDPHTGLVPFTPGFGNHCVSGGARKTGDLLWFWNSWGESWGFSGRAAIEARHINKQPQNDCWAIKNTMIDPQDPTNPPA